MRGLLVNEASKAHVAVFIVAGSIVTAALLSVLIAVIIRLNYTRRFTPCESPKTCLYTMNSL